MIKEVSLENFQGIQGLQSVRFAPLTLIFGANSAGKSSLVRSILLLKQSIDTSSQGGAKDLSFQGSDIDLASFANVVNAHDLEKTLTVELSSGIHNFGFLPGRSPGRRTMAQLIDRLDSVGLSIETSNEGLNSLKVSFNFNTELSPLELYFSFEWVEADERYYGLNLRTTEETLSTEAIEILNSLYSDLHFPEDVSDHFDSPDDFERFLKRDELPEDEDWAEGLSELRFRGLFPTMPIRPPSATGNENFQANRIFDIWESLFRTARNSLTRTLENVSHIKPLREIPERLVIVDSSKETSQSRAINASVSKWIERLTEGRYALESSQLESTQLSFMGTISSKYLVDKRTKTPVSFMDLGVGLSQVLPIIEELVKPSTRSITTSRTLKTVLMEQPELHLHPKMQAELMELFIETSLRASNPLQIIAETHSEAMILRLQKRIREGAVDRSKVSVLYADTDENGVNRITEYEIGADGEFVEDWPLSFADVRVREIF